MEDRPPVIDEATAVLDEVDAALGRLAAGTYRTCEHCGDEIPEALLQAAPTRRRCAAHTATDDIG